jgi:hypothetical protein
MRLTLVNRNVAERLTVDVGLNLSFGSERRDFPAIAIAEVKRERHGRSRARDSLKAMGLRPGALSKYCLGVATLERSRQDRMWGVLSRRASRRGCGR